MQTYSHVIITAALNRMTRDKQTIPINGKWLLLGSLLPDMPLLLLTLGYLVYNTYIDPIGEFIFGPRYDDLYFNNPFWITGHALFHAPPLIALYALTGHFFGIKRGRSWGVALFSFALGAASHSFIDILTHANDGPLLLYPFDWQLRFNSPISYWDPQFFGREFFVFEHILILVLLVYLVADWLRGRRAKQVAAEA